MKSMTKFFQEDVLLNIFWCMFKIIVMLKKSCPLPYISSALVYKWCLRIFCKNFFVEMAVHIFYKSKHSDFSIYRNWRRITGVIFRGRPDLRIFWNMSRFLKTDTTFTRSKWNTGYFRNFYSIPVSTVPDALYNLTIGFTRFFDICNNKKRS